MKTKEDYDREPCHCGHRADAHEGAGFVLPCGMPGCGCNDFTPKEGH